VGNARRTNIPNSAVGLPGSMGGGRGNHIEKEKPKMTTLTKSFVVSGEKKGSKIEESHRRGGGWSIIKIGDP